MGQRLCPLIDQPYGASHSPASMLVGDTWVTGMCPDISVSVVKEWTSPAGPLGEAWAALQGHDEAVMCGDWLSVEELTAMLRKWGWGALWAVQHRNSAQLFHMWRVMHHPRRRNKAGTS